MAKDLGASGFPSLATASSFSKGIAALSVYEENNALLSSKEGTAPSTSKEGTAPSTSIEGPPSTSIEGPPSTSIEGPPSTSKEGTATPKEGTVPPPKKGTATPKEGTVPPPKKGTAPPPKKGTAPPPKKGTAPPPKKGTAPPPKKGTAPPPKKGTAPPPKKGTAPPPKQGTAPPPKQGTAPPPTEGTAPPPKQGTAAPPTEGTAAPPTEGTAAPPKQGTAAPPKQGTAAPPKQGTAAPPKQGTAAPPTEGTAAPPTEGTAPPPTEGTAPPPKQGAAAPPTEETAAPPRVWAAPSNFEFKNPLTAHMDLLYVSNEEELTRLWDMLSTSKDPKPDYINLLRHTLLFLLSPRCTESKKVDLLSAYKSCCTSSPQFKEISHNTYFALFKIARKPWNFPNMTWDEAFNQALTFDCNEVSSYLESEPEEIVLARVHFFCQQNLLKKALILAKWSFLYHCRAGHLTLAHLKNCFSIKDARLGMGSMEWYSKMIAEVLTMEDMKRELFRMNCHQALAIIVRMKRFKERETILTLLSSEVFHNLAFRDEYCCTKMLFVLYIGMWKSSKLPIEEFYKDVRLLFVAHAQQCYIYLFVDILFQIYGTECFGFYVELFVYALNRHINEVHMLNALGKSTEASESEACLVESIEKLSTLFNLRPCNEIVIRECIFSAFMLRPTQIRLSKLQELTRILTSGNGLQSSLRSNSTPLKCGCGLTCYRTCRGGKYPDNPLVKITINGVSSDVQHSLIQVLEHIRPCHVRYYLFDWQTHFGQLEDHLKKYNTKKVPVEQLDNLSLQLESLSKDTNTNEVPLTKPKTKRRTKKSRKRKRKASNPLSKTSSKSKSIKSKKSKINSNNKNKVVYMTRSAKKFLNTLDNNAIMSTVSNNLNGQASTSDPIVYNTKEKAVGHSNKKVGEKSMTHSSATFPTTPQLLFSESFDAIPPTKLFEEPNNILEPVYESSRFEFLDSSDLPTLTSNFDDKQGNDGFASDNISNVGDTVTSIVKAAVLPITTPNELLINDEDNGQNEILTKPNQPFKEQTNNAVFTDVQPSRTATKVEILFNASDLKRIEDSGGSEVCLKSEDENFTGTVQPFHANLIINIPCIISPFPGNNRKVRIHKLNDSSGITSIIATSLKKVRHKPYESSVPISPQTELREITKTPQSNQESLKSKLQLPSGDFLALSNSKKKHAVTKSNKTDDAKAFQSQQLKRPIKEFKGQHSSKTDTPIKIKKKILTNQDESILATQIINCSLKCTKLSSRTESTPIKKTVNQIVKKYKKLRFKKQKNFSNVSSISPPVEKEKIFDSTKPNLQLISNDLSVSGIENVFNQTNITSTSKVQESEPVETIFSTNETTKVLLEKPMELYLSFKSSELEELSALNKSEFYINGKDEIFQKSSQTFTASIIMSRNPEHANKTESTVLNSVENKTVEIPCTVLPLPGNEIKIKENKRMNTNMRLGSSLHVHQTPHMTEISTVSRTDTPEANQKSSTTGSLLCSDILASSNQNISDQINDAISSNNNHMNINNTIASIEPKNMCTTLPIEVQFSYDAKGIIPESDKPFVANLIMNHRSGHNKKIPCVIRPNQSDENKLLLIKVPSGTDINSAIPSFKTVRYFPYTKTIPSCNKVAKLFNTSQPIHECSRPESALPSYDLLPSNQNINEKPHNAATSSQQQSIQECSRQESILPSKDLPASNTQIVHKQTLEPAISNTQQSHMNCATTSTIHPLKGSVTTVEDVTLSIDAFTDRKLDVKDKNAVLPKHDQPPLKSSFINCKQIHSKLTSLELRPSKKRTIKMANQEKNKKLRNNRQINSITVTPIIPTHSEVAQISKNPPESSEIQLTSGNLLASNIQNDSELITDAASSEGQLSNVTDGIIPLQVRDTIEDQKLNADLLASSIQNDSELINATTSSEGQLSNITDGIIPLQDDTIEDQKLNADLLASSIQNDSELINDAAFSEGQLSNITDGIIPLEVHNTIEDLKLNADLLVSSIQNDNELIIDAASSEGQLTNITDGIIPLQDDTIEDQKLNADLLASSIQNDSELINDAAFSEGQLSNITDGIIPLEVHNTIEDLKLNADLLVSSIQNDNELIIDAASSEGQLTNITDGIIPLQDDTIEDQKLNADLLASSLQNDSELINDAASSEGQLSNITDGIIPLQDDTIEDQKLNADLLASSIQNDSELINDAAFSEGQLSNITDGIIPLEVHNTIEDLKLNADLLVSSIQNDNELIIDAASSEGQLTNITDGIIPLQDDTIEDQKLNADLLASSIQNDSELINDAAFSEGQLSNITDGIIPLEVHNTIEDLKLNADLLVSSIQNDNELIIDAASSEGQLTNITDGIIPLQDDTIEDQKLNADLLASSIQNDSELINDAASSEGQLSNITDGIIPLQDDTIEDQKLNADLLASSIQNDSELINDAAFSERQLSNITDGIIPLQDDTIEDQKLNADLLASSIQNDSELINDAASSEGQLSNITDGIIPLQDDTIEDQKLNADLLASSIQNDSELINDAASSEGQLSNITDGIIPLQDDTIEDQKLNADLLASSIQNDSELINDAAFSEGQLSNITDGIIPLEVHNTIEDLKLNDDLLVSSIQNDNELIIDAASSEGQLTNITDGIIPLQDDTIEDQKLNADLLASSIQNDSELINDAASFEGQLSNITDGIIPLQDDTIEDQKLNADLLASSIQNDSELINDAAFSEGQLSNITDGIIPLQDDTIEDQKLNADLLASSIQNDSELIIDAASSEGQLTNITDGIIPLQDDTIEDRKLNAEKLGNNPMLVCKQVSRDLPPSIESSPIKKGTKIPSFKNGSNKILNLSEMRTCSTRVPSNTWPEKVDDRILENQTCNRFSSRSEELSVSNFQASTSNQINHEQTSGELIFDRQVGQASMNGIPPSTVKPTILPITTPKKLQISFNEEELNKLGNRGISGFCLRDEKKIFNKARTPFIANLIIKCKMKTPNMESSSVENETQQIPCLILPPLKNNEKIHIIKLTEGAHLSSTISSYLETVGYPPNYIRVMQVDTLRKVNLEPQQNAKPPSNPEFSQYEQILEPTQLQQKSPQPHQIPQEKQNIVLPQNNPKPQQPIQENSPVDNAEERYI